MYIGDDNAGNTISGTIGVKKKVMAAARKKDGQIVLKCVWSIYNLGLMLMERSVFIGATANTEI